MKYKTQVQRPILQYKAPVYKNNCQSCRAVKHQGELWAFWSVWRAEALRTVRYTDEWVIKRKLNAEFHHRTPFSIGPGYVCSFEGFVIITLITLINGATVYLWARHWALWASEGHLLFSPAQHPWKKEPSQWVRIKHRPPGFESQPGWSQHIVNLPSLCFHICKWG